MYSSDFLKHIVINKVGIIKDKINLITTCHNTDTCILFTIKKTKTEGIIKANNCFKKVLKYILISFSKTYLKTTTGFIITGNK